MSWHSPSGAEATPEPAGTGGAGSTAGTGSGSAAGCSADDGAFKAAAKDRAEDRATRAADEGAFAGADAALAIIIVVVVTVVVVVVVVVVVESLRPPVLLEVRPELCTDAPGFDRVAFHKDLDAEVLAFLRKHLVEANSN